MDRGENLRGRRRFFALSEDGRHQRAEGGLDQQVDLSEEGVELLERGGDVHPPPDHERSFAVESEPGPVGVEVPRQRQPVRLRHGVLRSGENVRLGGDRVVADLPPDGGGVPNRLTHSHRPPAFHLLGVDDVALGVVQPAGYRRFQDGAIRCGRQRRRHTARGIGRRRSSRRSAVPTRRPAWT